MNRIQWVHILRYNIVFSCCFFFLARVYNFIVSYYKEVNEIMNIIGLTVSLFVTRFTSYVTEFLLLLLLLLALSHIQTHPSNLCVCVFFYCILILLCIDAKHMKASNWHCLLTYNIYYIIIFVICLASFIKTFYARSHGVSYFVVTLFLPSQFHRFHRKCI